MKLKGTGDLIAQLKKNTNLDDVKEVVKMNTVELSNEMVKAAVFTKGYQTGATKRSIKPKIEDKGFTGKTGPRTEYAPYLIYGTRLMEAQDFFRPAYYKQREKFIKDMSRLMK